MVNEKQTWVPEGGGTEDPSFEALPAGFWNLRVESVESGWGKTSGQPYILWVWVVTDEERAGSKLFHRTSMSEQAKAFPGDGFYAVLNRLGLSDHLAGRELTFEELVAELADVAPGCEAVAAVSQYDYEGQLRNEIDEFWTPGPDAPKHQIFQAGAAPSSAPAAAGAAPVTGGATASARSRPPGAEPPF